MKDESLANVVLETLIYSDLFDQPLRPSELHRFLHGRRIGLPELRTCLANGLLEGYPILRSGDFLVLAGREDLVARRTEAERTAAGRLPAALDYGRRIARLPFVRMVGLTGALAVMNVQQADDFDYLIVSEPGRVWTSRLFVVALVRLAASMGETLCPNYFLSLDALELEDRSIFTARELAQMVLITGADVYDRLRNANAWADELLPNAAGPPGPAIGPDRPRRAAHPAERLLAGRAGDRLERWEMARKVRKFNRKGGLTEETAFDDHRVQGHFNGYRARTLAEFRERLDKMDGRK